MFKNIFKIAPGALQLFSFKDEEDLYNCESLKKHGVRVVMTVDKAVQGLNDLGAIVPILQNLGKIHVDKGILPEHYPVVGQALLDTLEAGLGKDNFEGETKRSWEIVYGVISDTMIGDNYGKK